MSRHLDRGRETLMDIFHRHRQAQEHELAAAALERAMQTPQYRPEALIWKGIGVLSQDPKLAFIYLSNASHALPQRADVHALLARSILAQGQPALASRYLSAVWQKMPHEPALRMMLWQARSQSETAMDLRRIILAHLPDITAGNELAFVLKLLAAQADMMGVVGVVRYLPEEKEIHGWAVDLSNIHSPASLQLEANGQVVSATASVGHPLLVAAGLPTTHGGIRIKVPNPTAMVHVRTTNGVCLLGSPVSAMPGFVPPLPAPNVGREHPVDVLIPVYDGLDETLECINSAIATRKTNRTPHRLVVLEDASPVPTLRKALKVLAAKGKIILVQRPANLGFIRSMNRGMATSPKNDVIWLNADTRVHGNWLDRLRATAYAADDIASVTPFTNNGELMSFPVSRVSADMPSQAQLAHLDTLASNVGSPAVELETGCGFCLYIKRKALDDVGYLDEVHLSRGYGEETDWCLRAKERGWRHMGATNVFVAHKGGVSFKEEKKLRVAYNNAILRKRFPTAEADYETFCRRDPLQPARNALQRGRLGELNDWIARQQPISPIELHVQPECPGAYKLALTYRQGQVGPIAVLTAAMEPLSVVNEYKLPMEYHDLVSDLQTLARSAPRGIACHLNTSGPVQLIQVLNDAGLACGGASGQLTAAHVTDQQKLAAQNHILIGDDLNHYEALNAWILQARAIRRKSQTTRLLWIGDSPSLKVLQATGIVYGLIPLPGLELDNSITLAGVGHVGTLLPNHSALTPAMRLSALYGRGVIKLDPVDGSSTPVLLHLDKPRTWASSQIEL